MRRHVAPALLALLAGLTLTAGTYIAVARATSPKPPAPDPPSERKGPELVFVFEPEYQQGDIVLVRLHNNGTRSFIYRSYYQACDLTYRTASGRAFIIPPGTHCDLIAYKVIRPGETVDLFTWKLDECVKDSWGCVRAEPLPTGHYTIEGQFRIEGDEIGVKPKVLVRGEFEIVA